MQIPTPKKRARDRLWHWLFSIFNRLWQGTSIPFRVSQKLPQTGIVIVYPFLHSASHSWFPQLRFVSPFVLKQNGKVGDMLQLNEEIKKLSVIWAFRSLSLFFICQWLQPERSLRMLFSCFPLQESSINLLRKIRGCGCACSLMLHCKTAFAFFSTTFSVLKTGRCRNG